MNYIFLSLLLLSSFDLLAALDMQKLEEMCPEGSSLQHQEGGIYVCNDNEMSTIDDAFALSKSKPRLLTSSRRGSMDFHYTYDNKLRLMEVNSLSTGMTCRYLYGSEPSIRVASGTESECEAIRASIHELHETKKPGTIENRSACEGELSVDGLRIDFPDGRVYKLDKSQSSIPRQILKKIDQSFDSPEREKGGGGEAR